MAGFFGYKDIVDFIGAVTDLDVVSAGISALSLISLIPIVGDAGAVDSKTLKFINRVSARRALDTVGFITSSKKIPLGLKLQILKAVDGTSIKKIRDHGISDEAIVNYATNRFDFGVLARGLDGARHTTPSPRRYAKEKEAENYLRSITPGALPKQTLFPAPGSTGRTGGRYPDVYSPTTKLAIEAKNGFIELNDFIAKQVRKDRALLEDQYPNR
ncbi:hypothetical protein JK386_11735 [Nocardioides sp. zg-536]|uniref:Uncharacterized protein n=1 Tax=Nocardioides faecalis TaxID=2803858 RepID=A0A938Y2C6_9ACTN|nr:hypothetical protein [Nocardioides faecalis]MBM9460576.1 hypothetical protein [Nocardioides faecalis]MBS4754361.1 hypothetical protein [Nocardioides faecalis]QVI57498.1 hypothetical protein KG111_10335 [Nocardioides faecalis]